MGIPVKWKKILHWHMLERKKQPTKADFHLSLKDCRGIILFHQNMAICNESFFNNATAYACNF